MVKIVIAFCYSKKCTRGIIVSMGVVDGIFVLAGLSFIYVKFVVSDNNTIMTPLLLMQKYDRIFLVRECAQCTVMVRGEWVQV